MRPFFCQVEAVETIIWLTEVARREKRYKHIWAHLDGGNKDANPQLLGTAMKMATGSKDEAKKNNEAARLWISGIEALNRKVGVRATYDLSATPFFLRGSGYAEGTLFPWTVSDFSLMDEIECGIVKLPRVPVADNLPVADMPIYRDLWRHIGKELPKKGASKSGKLDPLSIPSELQTALYALYGHYEKTFEAWKRAGIAVPPVFIVVCNNTSTSKLVYEWISGFERHSEDGEKEQSHLGHLALFRNYDQYGNRLARQLLC